MTRPDDVLAVAAERGWWRRELDARGRGLEQLVRLRELAVEKRRRLLADPELADELVWEVDGAAVETGTAYTIVVAYLDAQIAEYAQLIGQYRRAHADAGAKVAVLRALTTTTVVFRVAEVGRVGSHGREPRRRRDTRASPAGAAARPDDPEPPLADLEAAA